VQAGKKPDPRLAEVPTIYELMDRYRTPETGRRLAQVILSGDELGRPMISPPRVPADRVKILREAYTNALKDSDLIAEVIKSRLQSIPFELLFRLLRPSLPCTNRSSRPSARHQKRKES